MKKRERKTAILQPKDRIIVDLGDVPVRSANTLVKKLSPYVGCFRVSKDSLITMAKSVINETEEFRQLFQLLKHSLFWDKRFTGKAKEIFGLSWAVTKMGAEMFTVDCDGNEEALLEAVKAVEQAIASGTEALNHFPAIIGVPCSVWMEDSIRLAQKCGLDGVLVSPDMIWQARDCCRSDFLIIDSGVWPKSILENMDRKSIKLIVRMRPTRSIMRGADYIVIGERITKALSPVRAAKKVAKQIEEAIKERQGKKKDKDKKKGRKDMSKPKEKIEDEEREVEELLDSFVRKPDFNESENTDEKVRPFNKNVKPDDPSTWIVNP